jgi:pimeloyl-ACP methyl ester carboxylesterase
MLWSYSPNGPGNAVIDPTPTRDTALARTTFALSSGTFHALVAGAPNAPPLVFLHGFPDHPPTAKPFLTALARTHRVVAPWLRGYAPSPRTGPYDLDTLTRDVLELIERMESGPVALVGHDWGAVITYAVCARAPAQVSRAVTLAVPHPLTFLRALRDPGQLRHSWYMALFQLPGAEYLARAASLALVDRLWRAWSPRFRLDDARRAELHACLMASLPAPLEYYRALIRPLSTARDRVRQAARRIEVPLLQLHGAEDGCILPPSVDDAGYFADRSLEILPGRGHFLHLEDPEDISSRIQFWLGR